MKSSPKNDCGSSAADKLAVKAIGMLDRVHESIKIDMLSFNVGLDETIREKWIDVPKKIGDKGCRFTNLGLNDQVVYIPPNKGIYNHYHEDDIEYIRVLRGTLDYQLYHEGVLTKSGVLKRWDELTINPEVEHIVYAAEEETLIYVEFK